MIVRYSSILINLTFLMFCMNVYAEAVRLSDENAFLYYESRAEIPTPEYKLAAFFSSDYREARDEFTKHDLMKDIKPVLDRKLAKAASNNSVYIQVGTRLEEYDFNKHVFPTGLSESTFIPFQNGYALTFTNGNSAAFIPVEMEKARSMSSKLRQDRRATVILTVELLGTEERRLDWAHKKAIIGQITQMKVELKSGTEVGSIIIQ